MINYTKDYHGNETATPSVQKPMYHPPGATCPCCRSVGPATLTHCHSQWELMGVV